MLVHVTAIWRTTAGIKRVLAANLSCFTQGRKLAVLRLILANVQDYVQSEGISMIQDDLILESLTCSYPGVAGVIEVIFPVPGRSGSDE